MTHFDDDTLFEYVEGTSPVDADIASHVSSCGHCSTEVEERRELIATLATEDVWQVQPAAPRQFVLDVVSFAERARVEEQKAVALCDEVLSGPANWWAQRLRKSEGWQTAGTVRELLERWREKIGASPAQALQITALALEVANGLEITLYPSDYVVKLRAQAYRDHAYILSFMGRYREALDFTERSKRLFDQVPLPEYDLARLAIVKASVLRSIDRADEAISLINGAADTFLRFGDLKRHAGARMTLATALYVRGNVEEALSIWKSVENGPQPDPYSAVRLVHNIALCHSDLGQPEQAIPYVQRCVVEFELLELHAERTRSRWLLGHAMAACGKYADAAPTLQQAWREFESLDMIGEAGLVALELAETLLVLGRADEVPAICRDLIAQFTRAGMASRAVTALSFLREAVAIGQGTPSLVRHVYSFLRELPAEQPRLFAPAPTAGME
jgi:tetratricopeptide (TPR) repeat protein